MADPTPSPKVIVLISTRLRDDGDLAAYATLEARMAELVSQTPGYLGAKAFTADDGQTIALVEFESHEALGRWRDHPEHLDTQRRGREEFYASYSVRVCSIERAYDFDVGREPARRAGP